MCYIVHLKLTHYCKSTIRQQNIYNKIKKIKWGKNLYNGIKSFQNHVFEKVLIYLEYIKNSYNPTPQKKTTHFLKNKDLNRDLPKEGIQRPTNVCKCSTWKYNQNHNEITFYMF